VKKVQKSEDERKGRLPSRKKISSSDEANHASHHWKHEGKYEGDEELKWSSKLSSNNRSFKE